MLIRLWRVLRGLFMAKRLTDPEIAHRERMEQIDREHRASLWEFDRELHSTDFHNSLANTASGNGSAGFNWNQLANSQPNYGGALNKYAGSFYGDANEAAQIGNRISSWP